MNLQAIRANKNGLVEVDSCLPGPSNFIVDFTFSPLLLLLLLLRLRVRPYHLLQTPWRPNHSRYATNPNTITTIPRWERICGWVSSIPATTICRFPLSRRIAREIPQSLLVRNFKTLSFYWIAQKSYGQICFISTGGLLHLTECNYSCFRGFIHFDGDLFAIESCRSPLPSLYVSLKRCYIMLKNIILLLI